MTDLKRSSAGCGLSHNWLRPPKLLIAVLVAEGALFLSERFGWPGFAGSKGWPVPLATGTLIALIVLALVACAVSLVFRWRFQFSIQSLLLLVLAIGALSGWFVAHIEQARRQRAAVAAIQDVPCCNGAAPLLNAHGLPVGSLRSDQFWETATLRDRLQLS